MNTKMVACLFAATLLFILLLLSLRRSRRKFGRVIYTGQIFTDRSVWSKIVVMSVFSVHSRVTLVRVCRLLRLGAVSRGSS